MLRYYLARFKNAENSRDRPKLTITETIYFHIDYSGMFDTNTARRFLENQNGNCII